MAISTFQLDCLCLASDPNHFNGTFCSFEMNTSLFTEKICACFHTYFIFIFILFLACLYDVLNMVYFLRLFETYLQVMVQGPIGPPFLPPGLKAATAEVCNWRTPARSSVGRYICGPGVCSTVEEVLDIIVTLILY